MGVNVAQTAGARRATWPVGGVIAADAQAPYEPALDGVRALAALAVLVTHVAFTTGAYGAGLPGALLARLDVGVPLFFVLSGYLLYRPHARARVGGRPALPARAYLLRRAARILPAYLLVVLVVFTVLPAARAGSPSYRCTRCSPRRWLPGTWSPA